MVAKLQVLMELDYMLFSISFVHIAILSTCRNVIPCSWGSTCSYFPNRLCRPEVIILWLFNELVGVYFFLKSSFLCFWF